MPWTITATQWFSAATGAAVADMSAEGKSVTAWFDASRIGDPISMGAVWTGDGEPVGVLGMESTGDPDATVTSDADTFDLAALFPDGEEPNPDGSAGRKSVLLPQPALRFRWTYTRESGGEGATCIVHAAGNY